MDLSYVSQDSVRPSGDATSSHSSDRRLKRLTPRELQITRMVSCGETSKSIGQRLGISFRTVEAHRAHIIAKLGTRNLAELVLLTIGEWPELARRALPDPEVAPARELRAGRDGPPPSGERLAAMLVEPQPRRTVAGREEQPGQWI